MSKPDLVETYWRQCIAEVEELDSGRGYRIKCFGRSADLASLLLSLVASGQKTGTFSLLEEFSDENPLPEVGEQVIVTDFEGRPGCLYRIEEVETVPYREIGDRHVACEGPQLRDVGLWRDVHWPYWTEYLSDRGKEMSMEVPVVFQRFTTLHQA